MDLGRYNTVGHVPTTCDGAILAGRDGNLGDNNYSDGTNTGIAPGSGDILDISRYGGTATYSVAGQAIFLKLRVGHIQGTAAFQGDGTVTFNNRASVLLSASGTTGSAIPSLWVGNGKNGTLTIDGAGTKLTAGQLIEIGYGSDANLNATVNVTNGRALSGQQWKHCLRR